MKEYVASIILILIVTSLASYALYDITGLFVIPTKEIAKEKIEGNLTEEVQEVRNITEIALKCPESCDDFNPCTEDFCSEETNYTCKHVNLTGEFEGCKERIEGTCSKFTCLKGKCVVTEIPNCCGNKVCESSENCSSCPKDCGICPIQNITIEAINETNVTQPENVSYANHVVISEILTKSPLCNDREGFEFIELYNPTSSSINISNWWIVYYTSTKTDWKNYTWRKQLPSNAQIHAYSFYLIAVSAFWDNCTEKPSWVVLPDYNLGYAAKDGKITASKGTIALHSEFGNVMDAIGWGETNLYEGSSAVIEVGKSLERRPGYLEPNKGNGIDSDNNLKDFILREVPEPQNSSFKEILS